MKAHLKFVSLLRNLACSDNPKRDFYAWENAGCPVVEEGHIDWTMPTIPQEHWCAYPECRKVVADLAAANASLKNCQDTRWQMAEKLDAANARIRELEKRKTDSCDHCAASCASCGQILHTDIHNAALEEAAKLAEAEYYQHAGPRMSQLAGEIRAMKKGGA